VACKPTTKQRKVLKRLGVSFPLGVASFVTSDVELIAPCGSS